MSTSNDDAPGRLLSAYFERSIAALQNARAAFAGPEMERAIELCLAALRRDCPILVCGNGGSAADAMHIVGELVGKFLQARRAMNAICLASNPSVVTAWSNDHSFDDVFARQVDAYGRAGGVLIGLSTSGNSTNVVNAAISAKARGMGVIAFTGEGGGKLAAHADVLLAAPSNATPLIQQVHECLYHFLCEQIEARFFRAA